MGTRTPGRRDHNATKTVGAECRFGSGARSQRCRLLLGCAQSGPRVRRRPIRTWAAGVTACAPRQHAEAAFGRAPGPECRNHAISIARGLPLQWWRRTSRERACCGDSLATTGTTSVPAKRAMKRDVAECAATAPQACAQRRSGDRGRGRGWAILPVDQAADMRFRERACQRRAS